MADRLAFYDVSTTSRPDIQILLKTRRKNQQFSKKSSHLPWQLLGNIYTIFSCKNFAFLKKEKTAQILLKDRQCYHKQITLFYVANTYFMKK